MNSIKTTAKLILLLLSCMRLIPHILILSLTDQRSDIFFDIRRWKEVGLRAPRGDSLLLSFITLMTSFPEFRNIFYFRTGAKGKIFSWLCPPMPTLYIQAISIGPGLFIQHGFATIIAAKKIGKNCWINQQVTIGFSDANSYPTIEDNVTINAGAKIIGDVIVGANSIIGANAVVVKNVPKGCTVVGVPGRIVRRNGIRADEAL